MKKEKIGFIGLGKLGLPVALAINSRGYEVSGYDINPEVDGYLKNRAIPYQEIYSEEYLESHTINFADLDSVVKNSSIIFYY
jgi:UDP-N-acetyl-D-mannosaminuronate dehydrogenase